MPKQQVNPAGAVVMAPYSPGIAANGFVFVSGQGPVNPETRQVLRDDFEAAVRLTIQNVERILTAAGVGLQDCVKVTVFLKNMDDFDRMNRIYGEYFGEIKPARTCIQAGRLPMDIEIEIEAIASLP